MKLLMVGNLTNDDVIEDIEIARLFINDGHNVTFTYLDYPEDLDKIYDAIIRRSTWFTEEKQMKQYYQNDIKYRERILNQNLCTINFNGLFDAVNKQYLVDFFKKGYQVIPTIRSLEDVPLLNNPDYYLTKPFKGYDGYGQKKVTLKELEQEYNLGDIIQPWLKFESEIQFYFLNNELQYAFEFKGSKIHDNNQPVLYAYTEEELALASFFAKLNVGFIGIQRIDFLKMPGGQLLLLEIEDHSPYLNIEDLPEELKEQFLLNYKNMVYNTIAEYRNK